MTFHLHDDLEIGAATHTGCVRTANEDDFLVISEKDIERVEADGRLFVVADGMGGVSGGAEASRLATRELGRTFLARPGVEPVDRLVAGFAAACRKVYEQGRRSPQLADMGTTMTAFEWRGDAAVIGHIGDTRCLRLRRGEIVQLTEDHAMAEPRNLLTRCIGAGQETETADLIQVDVAEGDLFLLMTDGVWNLLEPNELAAMCRGSNLQQAAEDIVATCWKRGAPDNATVLLVRVRSVSGPRGAAREVELPTREVAMHDDGFERTERLSPPNWPVWMLAFAGLLAVGAWLQVAGHLDVLKLIGTR